MTRGIVYIVTGEEFLQQAKVSARTARESNDGINICLIITETLKDAARTYDLFDDIITVREEEIDDSVRDKSRFIHLAPYDKNLYLDGDTYVLGDLSPVFEGLERFEIMAAHEKFRPIVPVEGVPESFPELSAGVIAFRSNERVMDFFDTWREIYEKQLKNGRPGQTVTVDGEENLKDLSHGRIHDQPPFREALYKSDIDFCALPSEYNFHVSGWVYGEVKILHVGHSHDARKLADNINNEVYTGRTYLDSRGELYTQEGRKIFTLRPPFNWLVEKIAANDTLKYILRKTGLYGVSKQVYEKLRSIHI